MTIKILPITNNLTLISEDKVLDKRNGNIMQINHPVVKKEAELFLNSNKIPAATSVSDKLQLVYGLESTKIDLQLKTSDGISEVKSGFLVEVFFSGSDGKLKRLYKEDVEDPLDDEKTISDGFSNYFKLEVDI